MTSKYASLYASMFVANDCTFHKPISALMHVYAFSLAKEEALDRVTEPSPKSLPNIRIGTFHLLVNSRYLVLFSLSCVVSSAVDDSEYATAESVVRYLSAKGIWDSLIQEKPLSIRDVGY